jgi:hypothetical protein
MPNTCAEEGDKTTGEYMQKFKALSNAMAAAGSHLRGDEVIGYMLTKLVSTFNHIVASMIFFGETVMLAAFHSYVLHF